MRIILFGLGSIGRRHAQVLLDGFHHEIFAFRSGKNSSVNELGIKELYNWKEIEELKADIAFIANPTSLHIETALRCAKLGMHLFIEKPLSNSLKDISTLEKLCHRKNLTCYIAYCLRFHPVIKKMREIVSDKHVYHVRIVCSSYLPYWRKGIDWRKCYSASKRLGGGVILDLSHEFDYISYLFGKIKKIKGEYGRISDITIDAEDFADVLLTLENSIHVNLHLNFLSYINERTIKVDFHGGYLIGDLLENQVIYFLDDKKETYNFSVERNEFMSEQTQYFFDNLGNPSIMNNISESKQLLAKILELKNG